MIEQLLTPRTQLEVCFEGMVRLPLIEETQTPEGIKAAVLRHLDDNWEDVLVSVSLTGLVQQEGHLQRKVRIECARQQAEMISQVYSVGAQSSPAFPEHSLEPVSSDPAHDRSQSRPLPCHSDEPSAPSPADPSTP